MNNRHNKHKLNLIRVLIATVSLFIILCSKAHAGFFQPITTLEQYNIPIVTSLYKSDLGGVWLQDINGELRYFTGQHIVPSHQSFLDEDFQLLTFENSNFWMANHRTLKVRTESLSSPVIITQFNYPIEGLGSSNAGVWVSTEERVHLYSSYAEPQITLSKQELQKTAANTSKVVVNDVKAFNASWIIATNLGAFTLKDNEISIVKGTRNKSIEQILSLQEQRAFVLGTKTGALIFEYDSNHIDLKHKVGTQHVLSMAYFDSNLWIGTKNGLLKSSLTPSEFFTVEQSFSDTSYNPYALPGDKIYSLLNADNGTLWVSTENGIRIVNIKEKGTHVRVSSEPLNSHMSGIETTSSGETWFSTREGLYKVSQSLENQSDYQQNYEKRLSSSINSITSLKHVIWFTTNEGVLSFDTKTNEVKLHIALTRLQQQMPRQIVSTKGEALWFATQQGLYRYHPVSDELQNYGLSWIIEDQRPARITSLISGEGDRVYIGTDHGTYNYSNGRIQLNNATTQLGEASYTLITPDSGTWYMGSKGIRYQNAFKPRLIEISQRYDSARPLCAANNEYGVWVVTNTGVELYSHEGSWLKHFGGRVGLIEGEFLEQQCTFMSDQTTLALGSLFGLVLLDTDNMSASEINDYTNVTTTIWNSAERVIFDPDLSPHAKLKFDDHTLMFFGDGLGLEKLELDYKVQPNSINNWQPLIGNQLSLKRLHHSNFSVEYRPSGIEAPGNLKSVSVNVSPPWYLNRPLLILLSVVLLVAVFLIFYFLIIRAKKQRDELQNELHLSQSQLSHQSRVLLANSLHQRKQAHVRMKLISRLATTIKKQVMYESKIDSSEMQLGTQIEKREMVDAIESISAQNEGAHSRAVVIEINWLLMAIYESWKRDFAERGCRLQIYGVTHLAHVKIHATNLDSVINTLLASLLRKVIQDSDITLSVDKSDTHVEILISATIKQAIDIESESIIENDLRAQFSTIRHQINALRGEFDFESTAKIQRFKISLPIIHSQSQHISSTAKASFSEAKQPQQEEWFTKVLDLIENNYVDAEFSTAQAAKALFMSDRNLQRKFKSITGSTFKEHLIRVRLEKSAQLLMEGESVSEVAYASGFNDPSYFSQRFKTHFGISPSKFNEMSDFEN